MEQLMSYLLIPFLFCIIILGYLALTFYKEIVKKELGSWQKRLVVLGAGIIMSVVYISLVDEYDIILVVLTFLAAVGFYDFFISPFRKKENNE